MGFKLLSRVYSEITNTTPTEQAILAYLAFRASDETQRCFPSRDTIEAATHFGQTGISNGLNGLHEKKILQWVKGGRKSKGRGFSLANEYSFNFPKLSTELSTEQTSDEPLTGTICRDAASAYAATKHTHMPRGGNIICRDAATIIIDHKKQQPSVIKGTLPLEVPMEEVCRQEIIEVGRQWSAHAHTPATLKQRPPSLTQRAMEACGVRDNDNLRVFMSVMMKKGRSRCEDEILAFESEIRQGEHRNARNLAAILTSRLKQLPDEPSSSS